MAKGYAAIWMTFKQALELNAHVRKHLRWLSEPTPAWALASLPTFSVARR